MLFQLLFAYHQAPRYHILALPPLAILLLRAFDFAVPQPYRGQGALLWGSVGLGLFVALFVAAADDAHTRANRDYPARVAAERGGGDGEIYCVGHWGLQYYCEEQGFTTFNSVHGRVRKGDLVIVPENNHLTNQPKAFEPLPTGRPICEGNGPLLELVEEASYPGEAGDGAPPAEFAGTRLLGALHRTWPFSVGKLHHTLLYGALVPSLPYSWRRRDPAVPDERFMLLRARCDYAMSGERLNLGLGSYVGRMHLVSGWGAPLPWGETCATYGKAWIASRRRRSGILATSPSAR